LLVTRIDRLACGIGKSIFVEGMPLCAIGCGFGVLLSFGAPLRYRTFRNYRQPDLAQAKGVADRAGHRRGLRSHAGCSSRTLRTATSAEWGHRAGSYGASATDP
jgi:hypothetical protein